MKSLFFAVQETNDFRKSEAELLSVTHTLQRSLMVATRRQDTCDDRLHAARLETAGVRTFEHFAKQDWAKTHAL